jgi:Skp family chaperone for outer membrane proteins
MRFIVTRSIIAGAVLGASLVLAVGFGPVLAQQAGVGRPSVIATVRLSTVIEKLDKWGEAQANLTAMSGQVGAEQKRRQTEIEAMQTQLQTMVEAHGIDNPTAEMIKLQEDEALARLRFQAWARITMEKADMEKSLLLQDLYRSIKTTAATIANAAGYDLVLVDDSQGELRSTPDARAPREAQIMQQIGARRMLHANPALDITDELITRMNNEHRAGGGAAAKPQG